MGQFAATVRQGSVGELTSWQTSSSFSEKPQISCVSVALTPELQAPTRSIQTPYDHILRFDKIFLRSSQGGKNLSPKPSLVRNRPRQMRPCHQYKRQGRGHHSDFESTRQVLLSLNSYLPFLHLSNHRRCSRILPRLFPTSLLLRRHRIYLKERHPP
jgi:hypothetical protein